MSFYLFLELCTVHYCTLGCSCYNQDMSFYLTLRIALKTTALLNSALSSLYMDCNGRFFSLSFLAWSRERKVFLCPLLTTHTLKIKKASVSTSENRVCKRPLGRSLRFIRLHRSLHSLAQQRSVLQCLVWLPALFTGSLSQFAHSLVGWSKFMNMYSSCKHYQPP